MSQQQSSDNTNGAPASQANATAQSELRGRPGLYICTRPIPSPEEGLPASEGAACDHGPAPGSRPPIICCGPRRFRDQSSAPGGLFGRGSARPPAGPAEPKATGSTPTTFRFGPRPARSPVLPYGPLTSPVDESYVSGWGLLHSPAPTTSPRAPGGVSQFIRYRSLSGGLPSPGTMRAVAQSLGFAVGNSVPSSPSAGVYEERHRDYWRPRSMSCPEMLGCGFWDRSMYRDLNPNGNWEEYSDEFDDDDGFLDFDEYCAVVEELRATCCRGPGVSHAPRVLHRQPGSYSPVQGDCLGVPGLFHGPGLSRVSAQLYGQPGSYSPVQGYGPGGPGLFHDPGCYGHASMYDSPSPVEQQPELLEPRQFIELFRPRTLPQQHCEPGCCSCSSYVIRCPGVPSQQLDPEDPEDLKDSE